MMNIKVGDLIQVVPSAGWTPKDTEMWGDVMAEVIRRSGTLVYIETPQNLIDSKYHPYHEACLMKENVVKLNLEDKFDDTGVE